MKIKIGDVEYGYDRAGSGDPVLLVMGLGTPRIGWFHNDLGDPSGDGFGYRFVDPTFATPSGNNIFVVDLTQNLLGGTPWSSGGVKGFILYPNSSAVGYPVSFDWVRLTAGDAMASATVMPVSWSGGSGTSMIQVTDAGGSTYTVASGISATTFNWNYGVLPPGSYTLTVTRGSSVGTTTFKVNAPPTVRFNAVFDKVKLTSALPMNLSVPAPPWKLMPVALPGVL